MVSTEQEPGLAARLLFCAAEGIAGSYGRVVTSDVQSEAMAPLNEFPENDAIHRYVPVTSVVYPPLVVAVPFVSFTATTPEL